MTIVYRVVLASVLGGTQAVSRAVVGLLTPPGRAAAFFGFFNLASRIASALGPLVIWSGTVWLLHQQTDWLSALDASRVAFAGLAIAALAGWAVIRPLSDKPSAALRDV